MLYFASVALFLGCAQAAVRTCECEALLPKIDLSDCDKYEEEHPNLGLDCDNLNLCGDDGWCKKYCTFGSGVKECVDTCFPANAIVTLEDGSKKAMGTLKVGDKVHVGSGEFSEVFLFTHEMEATLSKFVKIEAGLPKPLLLTAAHYLYVNGKLAPARTVKVGDKVKDSDGKDVEVVAVSEEWAEGLYNPHTMHGDIVVDGILTSTYTETIHPTLAHGLLFPLRQMYKAGLTFNQDFTELLKSTLPKEIKDLFRGPAWANL